MNKNFFIQDQVNFSLVQTNIMRSMSQKFIRSKNVKIIHDSICVHTKSNWEHQLLYQVTLLAYNLTNKFKETLS